jgi:hypothetical protein
MTWILLGIIVFLILVIWLLLSLGGSALDTYFNSRR